MRGSHAVLSLSMIQWMSVLGEFHNADSIPYSIRWSGPVSLADGLHKQDTAKLYLKSSNDEEYECQIDSEETTPGDKRSQLESYKGASPTEIMTSVIEKNQCTSKLEPYWTYALCHGSTLRQYHEEKDPTSPSGSSITQEYLLGEYRADQQADNQDEMNPPSISLEGTDYPYYTVTFSHGTMCDLTGTLRLTRVFYICHATQYPILYEVKETSTCEYNAIVLISDICQHPLYSPVSKTSRVINCHNVGDSPEVPQGQVLFNHRLANSIANQKPKLRKIKPVMPDPSQPGSQPIGENGGQSGGTPSPSSASAVEHSTTRSATIDPVEAANREIGRDSDRGLLAQILSGQQCIHGGSGWWAYEYCHARSVKQYHMKNGKRTTEILLGTWSETEHLRWLKEHPAKKPKSPQFRKQLNIFFDSGDFCTETGNQRQVEVRLKCTGQKGEISGSSHAVAIYMVEPKTCQYILTIESSILCQAVQMADEYGIINMEILD